MAETPLLLYAPILLKAVGLDDLAELACVVDRRAWWAGSGADAHQPVPLVAGVRVALY